MNATLLLILVSFFTSTASAQFFTGPAMAGTGGAGRAAIEGSESAILNPATLSYMDRYYIAVPFAESTHPANGYEQTYGLMLADGTPDKMVPGAISYLRRRVAFGGTEANLQDVHVAIGGQAYKYVSIGVAGHYRTFEQENLPDYFQTNGDFGALVTPLENLGIAFVAYNFLSAKDSVPLGIRDVPTLAVGINYLYGEAFAARLDLVRPDKYNPNRRTDVQLGIQTTFAESFFLRFGSNWKETEDKTYLTTGFGYQGPRLSVNYAYQQDVRESAGTRHIVDLWMGF